MRKKWGLIITVICCCIFLFACVVEPDKPKPDPSDGEKDPFYTDGFTKGTVERENVYQDLLGGVGRPLDAMNSTAARFIDADFEFDLFLNDLELVLRYRLHYDKNAPNSQAMMVEVLEKTSNRNVVTLYYYAGDTEDAVYLQIGEGTKFKIPLPTQNFFRFQPNNQSFSLSAYSTIFNSVFLTKGDVRYEYKRDRTTYIRHYLLELDIPKTLKEMVEFSERQNLIPTETVELILDTLLDVSIADVRAGNLPDITMKIDFVTTGGLENEFGRGNLKSLRTEVAVKNIPNDATALLLQEKTVLEITKFTVQSTSQTAIPDKKRFADWTDYRSGAFRFTATVVQNGRDLTFCADVQLNDDHRQAKAYAYVQNLAGEKEMEIIYQDGKLNVYLLVSETKSLRFELEVDIFSSIFEAIGEVIKQDSKVILRSVFYILGNFATIADGQVNLTLNNGFFRQLVQLDSDTFIDIMQNNAPEGVNVYEVLTESGWEPDMEYSFCIKLTLDKDMLSRISEVKIPTR